jgi:hypothetical protein
MPSTVKAYQYRSTRSRCQYHKTKGEVQGPSRPSRMGRRAGGALDPGARSRRRGDERVLEAAFEGRSAEPERAEVKGVVALVMLSRNCDLCAQCGGMKTWVARVVMGAPEGPVAARRSTSILLSLSISYTVSRGYQPCLLIIVIGGASAAPVSKLCRRSSASARLSAEPVGETAGS